MDPIKIFKDTFIKHRLEGKLDLRITVTLKGIKVNTGLGFYSNKPITFDLNEAFIDSLTYGLTQIIHSINYAKTINEKSQISYYTRRKDFIVDVLNQLETVN